MKMSSSAKDAKQELGNILRKRRLEQNLTQRDLAQKVGLDYTYVSKIENAMQAPSVESLIQLAETLGLSNAEVNELLALMGRLPDELSVQQRRLWPCIIPNTGGSDILPPYRLRSPIK